jgi:hypothetical protein
MAFHASTPHYLSWCSEGGCDAIRTLITVAAPIKTLCIVAAAGLTIAANWPYFSEVRRGKAKPRLVSWLIWTGAMTVGVIQASRGGQIPGACYTGACAVGCAAIVVFGWRHGERDFGHLDAGCLVLGGAGVALLAASALWPAFVPLAAAVALSVATDFTAYLPTFQHGWRNPDEEPWLAFAMYASGAALTLAIADFRVLVGVIYPLYLLAADVAMTVIILASPNRKQTWSE